MAETNNANASLHDYDPTASLRSAAETAAAFAAAPETAAFLREATRSFAEILASGGKLLAAGNGGSSTQAGHFAEELTGRFHADRRPLAALACTDAGHITCTANDYGYDEVFARWITALARPGDAVLLLSTSGNSENIVRAAAAAKQAGATTVALLGNDGGRLAGACDLELICPGAGSDRVQECHLIAVHLLIEGVEGRLGVG
ncbi:MAG: SIS domain-containing protein [Planctomycetota bacterium]